MTTSKKFASLALMVTTSVWFSGALLIPVAQAQTATDIQAQINALLAQIQQLQAKLSAAGGTASSSYTYTRNLTVGSKGADVTALQNTLISGGYLKIAAPTGYFGSLTKAALAAWQKANGVSPSVGYFGPKTRAALSAAAPAGTTTGGTTTGGTTTGGTTTGGTTTGGTTTAGVKAPASGLAVSLASNNPAPGSLIAGSARGSVLAINLTAGVASGVTVSDIKFHKTGVVSDSSIAGAYLVENGQVLYQYQSLSNGVIDFGGLTLNVAAGQTRTLWLQIDTASGVNAGNTVSFSLASNADITSADATGAAITESGNFPLNGNTFTVTTVSSPSIATLTVASTSIGNQVTAGTQNNIVGGWQFTVNNSAVNLNTLNLRVIGSASKGDIRNVKLYANGAQVGATLASVASDGTAYFNLSSSPVRLNTGTNNIQVFADVMGSPSFNFQFEILNAYDVYALDSQYNVPVTAGSNVGTQVSIKQGSITVTQDSSTPTGNIAKGQNAITLAKFDVYAAGEAVKIKFLQFHLSITGTTSTSASSYVKNVALVDDAGGQVGSTINTPPSSNTCTDSAAAAGLNAAGTTYTDCFGTSGSPINYIVPANTTRVLSLKADIPSAAGFSTVTASLDSSSNSNLQGLTSSQSANSGAVSGSALTLASAALTVAQNTAVGVQSYAANTQNKKIGSYALTASSAEGVSISNVTVTTVTTSTSPYPLQNLKVMVGGTQFGSTVASLSSNGSQSFSGTAFTVPAGQTTVVDVYADILSNATGTYTAATTLSGCSGSGVVSFSAVSCSSVAGQNISIAGPATVQIALDSASPAASQITMGSTGNTLAAFRFTETSNADDVKITDLNVIDSVSATSTVLASFGNLCFYNGSTSVGCVGSADPNDVATDWLYRFHFASPVVVPKSNSISLTLKGDASSFVSSGATDNSAHSFQIEASAAPSTKNSSTNFVTALGATSNSAASVTTSTANVPHGNTMTVLRTKLTTTATALGNTSSRSRTATDDLGTLNFAADSAGALQLNSVSITFSGSAPSAAPATPPVFYATSSVATTCTGPTNCPIALYDSTTNTYYYPTDSASSTGVVRFSMSNYNISGGTTKSFTLRMNSSLTGMFTFDTGKNGISQSLTAQVAATSSAFWTDAVSGGTSGLFIPASTVPFTVNSVSYAAGT